ncbi:chromate efflux transporter [Muribacter muris]|uniref:Chromate efflux transporter n=1 Tax=Muribacter muris TaxID=67855 RepID=A0A4Y9K2A1_9PAST|nr:chromate efflux transporter [Muribacter muris]MBF0784603.1 chromate efflux transporter [Muribacter muris]MBF0828197.1 chromate efflux transporter [Muribacter muris]TFV11878.1 chromate efflux transporter [Muribacter muris]
MVDKEINLDRADSALAIFWIFLKLGCTSFGGPIAHLGYFHNEFVVRRKWLAEQEYADLVALCQFLPGPASSQVGIALGLSRAGYLGALAAWAGFTLPSAVMLMCLAQGIIAYGNTLPIGMLQGLKLAAVAVVAQAVWEMGKKLCPDRSRIAIMLAAACGALFVPSVLGQIGAISVAAVIGFCCFQPHINTEHRNVSANSNRVAFCWLILFFILLIGLPLLSILLPNAYLTQFDLFFRSGSLVFGGGHTVLPLLQAETVAKGVIDHQTFLAGYSVAQAVPGPLFTFAAFLGTSIDGTFAGMIALFGIFLPSFLLVFGVLPFWQRLRQNIRIQAALLGVNAAVVGLLLAVLYQPIWLTTVKAPQDFALTLVAFFMLSVQKLPPWLVVAVCGGIGWGIFA